MTTTYRAAYLGETVLTGLEHSHLSDAEILAAGLAELDRTDPIHATDADGRPLAPRDAVRVGDWTTLATEGGR